MHIIIVVPFTLTSNKQTNKQSFIFQILMAEIVVSAVVNVLVEKLISGDLMKLARSEGIDSQLKKWKNSLQLIQAVLADAHNTKTC